MDANGTRYHLLLGRDDWLSPAGGQTLDPNLAWDATRLEVTLQPRLYHFAVAPRPAGLSLDGRRGAGREPVRQLVLDRAQPRRDPRQRRRFGNDHPFLVGRRPRPMPSRTGPGR